MSILGQCPICQETCSLFDRVMPGAFTPKLICEKCDMQLNAEAEQVATAEQLLKQLLEKTTKEKTALAAQVSILKKCAAAVCVDFPEKISAAQFSLMHAVSQFGMLGDAESCLKTHDALNAAKAVEEAADYMMAYLGLPKDTTSVSTMALKEFAAKIKAKAGIK